MESSSSKDYSMGILGVTRPKDCSCQELLSLPNIVQYGWLRKRSLRNKVLALNWPRLYVILASKCLYHYSNETAKKPSGSVSLYGFNRICRASGQQAKDVVWAFKLEHIQPSIRSLYFSASSEKEMLIWMRAIKQEMMIANGKDLQERNSASDSQYGESIASEDSWGLADYNALEGGIYEEAMCSRPLSTMTSSLDGNDSDFEEGEEPASKESFVPSMSNQLEPSRVDKHKPSEANRLNPSLIKQFERVGIGIGGFKPSLPERMPLTFTSESSEPEKVVPTAPPDNMYDVSSSCEQTFDSSTNLSGEDYWNSVNFNGSKNEASDIISSIAEDGVFLVRKSIDNSNVLVVYAGSTRKYKIIEMDGVVTLSTTEPKFDSLESLLYHYFDNDLPNTSTKLQCPFQLHYTYQPHYIELPSCV